MSSQQTEIYRLIHQNIELQEQLEDAEEKLKAAELRATPSYKKCTRMEEQQYEKCAKCAQLREELSNIETECLRLTNISEQVQGLQRSMQQLERQRDQYYDLHKESSQALFELKIKVKREYESRPQDAVDLSASHRDLEGKYKKMEQEYAELVAEVKHLTTVNGGMEADLRQATVQIQSLKEVNQLITRQTLFNKEVDNLKAEVELWKSAANQYENDFKLERERCNQLSNKFEQQAVKNDRKKGEKQREYDNQVVQLRSVIQLVNFQANEVLRVQKEMENKLYNFNFQAYHEIIKRLIASIGHNVTQIKNFAEATKNTVRKHLL